MANTIETVWYNPMFEGEGDNFYSLGTIVPGGTVVSIAWAKDGYIDIWVEDVFTKLNWVYVTIPIHSVIQVIYKHP